MGGTSLRSPRGAAEFPPKGGIGGGIKSPSRTPRRLATLALAGLLLGTSLVAAAPAAGQDEGTTTTTPLPGAPVGEPPSANAAAILSGGKASIPAGAPYQVARAIQAANRIHRRTYIWGG